MLLCFCFSLCCISLLCLLFFFFNDTATTEIYTLSLHDALPISPSSAVSTHGPRTCVAKHSSARSEEHTSELQSQSNLVCRLLLEKKNKQQTAAPRPPQGTTTPRRHKRRAFA